MNRPRLTRRQLSILLFIATYHSAYHRAPSYQEIAARHRVTAQSIAGEIARLNTLGYVTVTPNVHRSLQLTGKALA